MVITRRFSSHLAVLSSLAAGRADHALSHLTPALHLLSQGLLAAIALFWMFVFEIMPPRWGEYFLYIVVGFPVGLGFSFWKHKTEQHKLENIDKARV